MTTVTPAIRSRHSEEEIEKGLVALALNSGNKARAHKELKEMGVNIAESTLRDWKKLHAVKYQEIQARELPKLRAAAAEAYQAASERRLEVGNQYVERLEKALAKGDIDPRELSNIQRNLDTGAGIFADKASNARGDAPPPQLHISITESVRSLKASGANFTDAQGKPIENPEEAIEGTATELQPEPAPSN